SIHTGYLLQRRFSASSTYGANSLHTGATLGPDGTTFFDQTLIKNVGYDYFFTPMNGEGFWRLFLPNQTISGWNGTANDFPAVNDSPMPLNFSARTDSGYTSSWNGGIVLTWDLPQQADFLLIERADDPNGPFTALKPYTTSPWDWTTLGPMPAPEFHDT